MVLRRSRWELNFFWKKQFILSTYFLWRHFRSTEHHPRKAKIYFICRSEFHFNPISYLEMRLLKASSIHVIIQQPQAEFPARIYWKTFSNRKARRIAELSFTYLSRFVSRIEELLKKSGFSISHRFHFSNSSARDGRENLLIFSLVFFRLHPFEPIELECLCLSAKLSRTWRVWITTWQSDALNTIRRFSPVKA